jgi:type IV pilus assembly protein PilA
MLQATMRRLAEARATEIEGEEAAESGFTLIELMVVLLIIAILLAIAIPTFLGVTNTAGDRAAQSNLTNAVTEAKALYQVNQSYSGTTGAYSTAAFTSQAPEFNWTTGACSASAVNCVSELVFNVSTSGDGQGLSLAVYSAKTTTCWYAFDVESTPAGGTGNPLNATTTFANAGTYYGKQSISGATTCTALNPDTDTHITIGSGSGQNYSNAVAVS